MEAFLQLRGKPALDDKLYTLLRNMYEAYKNGLEITGDELKNRIEPWVKEQLNEHQPAGDEVTPLTLISAIQNRVCEIAGHVWMEIAENIEDPETDDISAGTEPRDPSINASVVEFLPASFDILQVSAAMGLQGRPIIWSRVTDKELFKVFLDLFEPSRDNKDTPAHPRSYVCGAVSGEVLLHPPDKVRELSQHWFTDRKDAYISPKWPISEPLRKVEELRQDEGSRRYSYTPEHYQDGDNCVTWLSRAMDQMLPDNKDWLDVIEAHCRVSVAHEGCARYHLKEWGSMKCTVPYVEGADVARRLNGLRTFTL